jgi:Animal haem peroxidase
MTNEVDRRRYSRRRFLGVAGAGAAGALTVGAGGGRLGLGDTHAAAAAPSRSDRFGRMFPGLSPFAQPSSSLPAALNALGAQGGPIDARDDVRMEPGAPGPLGLILDPGRNEDSQIPAGITFLGQFVDHDVTFDETSQLGIPKNPEDSPNTRQPALNLDSVYGGGWGDAALVLPDGQMRVERCDPADPSSPEDLPRLADGTAVLADRRNDENVMLAGLHAAILRFHNHALDLVGGSDPATRFAEARRLTTWHYQWIVLHQFLPAIVGQRRVDQARRGRRYYRPSGDPFIPVEFQIAYRLHTLARPSYRLNFTGGPASGPLFLFLFHPSQNGSADPDDLRGGQRAPRRFVDWQTFFPFPGFEAAMRRTKKLDRLLSTPLFTLPLGAIASGDPPTVLAQRNLLRHVTWGIPSGQAIAKAMNEQQLGGSDLSELREFGHDLERSTPLWHYVNAEAELMEGGERLGPVGGRIVAEVLVGLLELDSQSFLSQPGWRPTLPAPFGGTGTFTMSDFLAFAGVDPRGRGF